MVMATLAPAGIGCARCSATAEQNRRMTSTLYADVSATDVRKVTVAEMLLRVYGVFVAS